MKKFLNLCLALCLLCGLNGVHSVSAQEGQTGDDEIIKCDDQGIPDPALYAEVLEAGDSNKDGVLTKAEAEGIERLFADDYEIANLQGIEKLTNLTDLSLQSKKITDLKEIVKLTNLTGLSLSDTGITSIKGIENLTNLTRLDLSDTGITSIKGIENLTNLTSLNLRRTSITSIKGIENLTNLTDLNLSNTGITSIKGIVKLTNLTSLDLSSTGITTLNGIENLTNLTDLNLSNTGITSIKGIENLINLKYLNISNNDLSELVDLTKLVNLDNRLSPYYSAEKFAVNLALGNPRITIQEYLAKLPSHISKLIKYRDVVVEEYEITAKVNEPIYYHDGCALEGFSSPSCGLLVGDRTFKIGLKDDQDNINYNEIFSATPDDWKIVMTGRVLEKDSYSCTISNKHEEFEAFDNAMKDYWSTSNSKYQGDGQRRILEEYIVKENNLNEEILNSGGGCGSTGPYRIALVPIHTGSTYVTFRNSFYNVRVKVNVVDDTDDNTVDKPSVDENKPKHEFVSSDNGIPTNTSDKLRDDNVLGMTINMPNSDTATADIFQALKETGKNLTFNVKGENDRTKYSWTFEGNDIQNPNMDLDLSINFETEKQQEIQNITNQSNMFYISFVHHGELPGRAKIKVDVSDKFKDGDYIYLYYYNEEKGTIERKGRGYEVKDGYAEFEIDHCSVYFFTKEPVKTDSKKDSNMIKNTATDGSQSNASTIVLAVMVLGLLGFVVIKNKATE